MTKIRLHYFKARGRAEGIRKLLHYKHIPYEEVTILSEEWPEKKKSKFPSDTGNVCDFSLQVWSGSSAGSGWKVLISIECDHSILGEEIW